jgi:hypothetical protein
MEFLSQRYTHRILQTSVVVKDSCYVPEIQYGYIECLVKLSASDIYHGNTACFIPDNDPLETSKCANSKYCK